MFQLGYGVCFLLFNSQYKIISFIIAPLIHDLLFAGYRVSRLLIFKFHYFVLRIIVFICVSRAKCLYVINSLGFMEISLVTSCRVYLFLK